MTVARYLAVLALCLLPLIVLARVLVMKRRGIQAMKFAGADKRDFLILPFALFYFCVAVAAASGSRAVNSQEIFHAPGLAWIGVALCFAGLLVLVWSIISFGRSFRVGIDVENPNKLVTTGVFAFSRNPIYVAFAFVLCGEFLVFQNLIFLIYIVAGFWLFHRQVLLEEEYLTAHYGQEYIDYRKRVRRYL